MAGVPPTHIRSDNGSEFTAQAVRDWLQNLGVKTLFIEPGSPWENGWTTRDAWPSWWPSDDVRRP